MSGWTLVWRWMNLTHSQNVFQNVMHELHMLSDDRKRIIHRVLSHAIESWGRTQAEAELQQVAYTVRLAFLVHLFQFNTGVYTRLDAIAICAAGHPLSVFEAVPQLQAPQPQVDPEQPQVEQDDDPQQHRVEVYTRDTQTQVTFGAVPMPSVNQDHAEEQEVHTRLQEYCIHPDMAASDELDLMTTVLQPFVGLCRFCPTCHWEHQLGVIRTIVKEQGTMAIQPLMKLFMLGHEHWFVVSAELHNHLLWIEVLGFPSHDPEEFTSFIHALSVFLRYPVRLFRATQQSYPCPWRMCGFRMLLDVARHRGVRALPTCQHVFHSLQTCRWHDMIEYVIRHATQAWQTATDDTDLVAFAFVTRVLHIEHLVRQSPIVRHHVGGGFDPPWFSGMSLPSLSEQARSSISDFVKVHVPVEYVCSCKVRGFKQYMQDWYGTALVTCKIDRPARTLASKIGPLSVAWPACAHEQIRFLHIAIPHEIWSLLGPDMQVHVVEAKLLQFDGKFIVDIRAPQSGISPIHTPKTTSETSIHVGEFFAGGFSGWAFALRSLVDAHIPVKSIFAIEHDAIAAKKSCT